MKIILSLIMSASFSLFAAEVDLKKSSFEWHGSKVTGKHYGKVPLKSAEVKMKDGKLIGGIFVADIANFTVEDLKGEWATKFINHMKSDDFFNVAKYPTATFKITSVVGGKISGDLTVRGKTNPVSFEYKQEGKTFTGEMVFDRTKFDMIYGSKNFFKNLGDKVINNKVRVKYKFVVK